MFIDQKKLLFFILFAAFLLAGAYSGGKKEDVMPAAKQLVEEKKYSEAVKLLAEVVKNQPERLDEVESLMAVIRGARNQYNINYSNLIQLLKKENLTDQDIAEAYNLINEMEKIDADPDQAIAKSFESARRTIVFRYNDLQFRDIMDRALVLLDEKKYWEALALYSSAVGLHRDFFVEDYAEEEIVTEADTMIAAVKNLIQLQIDRKNEFTLAAAKAEAESSITSAEFLRSGEYTDLNNIIARMANIREQAASSALSIDLKKQELLREGDYDVPYLSTANRVILGRTSIEQDEGVLAAIDLIWNNTVDENSQLLSSAANDFFDKGEEMFASGEYAEAENSFLLSKDRSEKELPLIRLKGYSITPANSLELSESDIRKIYNYMPQYLEAEKMMKAGGDYATLSQIMQRIAVIEKNYTDEKEFNQLLAYRQQVSADNTMVSINQKAWEENETSLRKLKNNSFEVDNPLDLSIQMKELFENYGQRFTELAVIVTRTGFDLVYDPLSGELEDEKENAEKGFKLVEGTVQTIGSGADVYTANIKYPQQAVFIFRDTLERAAATEREFRTLKSLIADLGSSASSHPLIAESSGNAEKALSEIDSLKNKINRYQQSAQELLTQAEIFRNQGNRYLAEAKLNLDRLNFNLAREKLQQAREGYLNSLTFNEDEELRNNSDREIAAISEEIVRLQTKAVVETVRKNLVLARDYYTRERFGDAENLLINSQTMWRSVNTEDNKEIEYWLSLIQTALSVRSGRFIAETDPLYNEMTQVLNLARSDYAKAVEADKAGNRDEMLRLLSSAEEKLRYINIPFPLNQETSVLSLKILKLKDKDNFNTLFRERYELARERIDINPSESYIMLKDLQVINPSWPGINQTIYRAEIKLGIRTPPPDQAKIREAETLYQRAYSIVLSNVRSNYPTALEYLNRAFELNPDSAKITSLKDRVQSEMGGTTLVVLSSYAQQQYRLAEQEFINGNYYASLAIVEKLLQDNKNRNYSPLIELKRRIDSKI
ncbi:MAG: hypothetical protein RBT69_04485 [Spirochaetia bacterium]|nr:hypothetical protein [Spirochaetia bacterium]